MRMASRPQPQPRVHARYHTPSCFRFSHVRRPVGFTSSRSVSWAIVVTPHASKVEITTTQKGGAVSTQTYSPACPSCTKDAKSHEGETRQGGTVEVSVSKLNHLA